MLDAEKAYTTLEEIIKDYNARENEASIKTKFLMLMNGWSSPFIACTELVKFIERQGDRKLGSVSESKKPSTGTCGIFSSKKASCLK